MKQKTNEVKQIRLARVLELYSQSRTERQIAEALKISPATVHRDIVELREAAIKGLEDHISNVPFQWTRAIASFDMLIRRANDLLDSQDLDKIALIKLIAELTKGRLDLYSAPEIMKRMVEHQQKLKQKIEQLRKESGSQWEFVSDIQNEAGKAPKITKKAVKRRPVQEWPVV